MATRYVAKPQSPPCSIAGSPLYNQRVHAMKTLFILMLSLAAFNFTVQAQFTILKHLDSGTTGKSPYGDLVSDGTYLYGMASSGGANTFFGTIFKIKPDG